MRSEIYNQAYEGWGAFPRHDNRNELGRWFDNYKIDRDAHFYENHEILLIEERGELRRHRKVYVGTIESGAGQVREIRFEPGAPPPPTFYHSPPHKREPSQPRPMRLPDSFWITPGSVVGRDLTMTTVQVKDTVIALSDLPPMSQVEYEQLVNMMNMLISTEVRIPLSAIYNSTSMPLSAPTSPPPPRPKVLRNQ